MSEKRFLSKDYGSDYYTEIVDNEKQLDPTIDNPSQRLTITEAVDLLNELYEELEARKKIESTLRRQIAKLKYGKRYTYFKGHSGYGIQDNVDCYNDIDTHPSLICVVSTEEEAERVCDYLNSYESDLDD